MRSFLLWATLLVTTAVSAQSFTVEGADTPAFDPVELIEEVCLGAGIEVLQITYNGDPSAVGRFSGGDNAIGLSEGFVMTTGYAATTSDDIGVDSPASMTASTPNNSQAGFYAPLVTVANSFDMWDVAVYTIRFVPTADSIQFRYIFASEEYPEFVCTQFNDAFGFFLEGPSPNGGTISENLAIVPGSDLPVSVNSVNGGTPGSAPNVNLVYCNEATNGSLDYAALFNLTEPNAFPVYDGYTDVFTASAAVVPCQEYTIELAIADFGDKEGDSAIFFEAESFCSFGTEPELLPLIVEDCGQTMPGLSLADFPATEYPLTYTIGGTAQAGVDYTGLPASGQITSVTDSLALPLEIIADEIVEELETIVVTINGANCFQRVFVLRIVDGLLIEGPGSALCSPAPITLQAVGDEKGLEEFDLLWSTADTTASIGVNPTETTTYTLTYTNELGSCTTDFTLEVGTPESNLDIALCRNEESITVNGTTYDFDNPSGTEVLEGASVGGCDSIVHINITPAASGTAQLSLCANETALINGTTYGADRLTGVEVLAGAAAGGCDSVLTVVVTLLPEPPVSVYQAQVCVGEFIIINGTAYGAGNANGTETLIGAAANGCDSVVQVNLDIIPTFSSELEVIITEGDAYSFGGQNYQTSGDYTEVFTAQNGCDSTVTLFLRVAPTSSTLTDSVAVGQTETACVSTSIFQQLPSLAPVCTAHNITLTLDPATGCATYMGLATGVDTTCLVACDELGICDTTYLVISVFDNLLAAVPDMATTPYTDAVTVPVLDNDWISETVLTDQYLVTLPQYGMATLNAGGTITYEPDLLACLQTDTLSYAICNDIGCDTAQVTVFLEDVTGACSPVWPGDVNNDGIVNQIDHWAVGLAYGQNGPARPNASFEWIGQPAIDWNGTITFIAEFNLKYADCNGTGQINVDDTGPIYVNWGLTHPLQPITYAFPERAIPAAVEATQSATEATFLLNMGDEQRRLVNAYGLGLELQFDPNLVSSLSIGTNNSVLGQAGDDLLVLEKMDYTAGRGYISLVRNDQQGIHAFGEVGRLHAVCPSGDCGTIRLTNRQLLQANGQVFNLVGEVELSAGVVASATSTEKAELRVYPNPTKGLLSIEASELGTYQLTNSQGQGMKSGVLLPGTHTITMRGLPTGLYLLTARIGKEWYQRRVVLTR